MMKHSHHDKKPQGFSKGRNNDVKERTGPIMMEDIMSKGPAFNKSKTTIHKMVTRTDPTNDSSPVVVKRKSGFQLLHHCHVSILQLVCFARFLLAALVLRLLLGFLKPWSATQPILEHGF